MKCDVIASGIVNAAKQVSIVFSLIEGFVCPTSSLFQDLFFWCLFCPIYLTPPLLTSLFLLSKNSILFALKVSLLAPFLYEGKDMEKGKHRNVKRIIVSVVLLINPKKVLMVQLYPSAISLCAQCADSYVFVVKVQLKVPVVVRLEGTNVEQGKRILKVNC